MRSALFLLLLVALTGCGASPAPEPQAGGGKPRDEVGVADLCVSNECGERIEIADIPDAENLLFSDDGRLFVSGGENVYEITRNDDGRFATRALSAAACGFTGLTIQRKHLYATCGDGRFFAAKLDQDVALAEIFQMSGMCIANGTDTGPDGRIYIVDEPLNCMEADPKIVALTLDRDDPMRVVAQDTWLQGSPTGTMFVDQGTVMRFPNGLRRDGNTFYSTDGGTVFSVGVSDEGVAGAVTPLFFEPTAHDDLGLVSDGILVTDFFGGRILLLARDGTLLQDTLPGTFHEPSSVRLGQPPMFAPTDILVTDKGVITEMSLPIDKLFVFRRKAT